MTFIIFILILSILIVVHEWGHYIAARKCGVKVDQFSLGFGPKLFSRIWDGTEFCLCLIPLGGYVKMAGDERSSVTGQAHEFLSKSVSQRSFIVVMGPAVNLILAYFCFWIVFMVGKVDLEATSKKVPAIIGQILPNSPSEKAGLLPKDQIVSINGKKIEHWLDFQVNVSESKEETVNFEIIRDGQVLIKEVKPEDRTQKDIFGRIHHVRKVGVGPLQIQSADELVIVRYDPLKAFLQAGVELKDISIKTYVALFEMFMGLRSPKEAMGIVGMFFVIKYALTIGFAFLLHIVGIISASLALFNLLPLIPLDGGHLLLYGIEKIRGKRLSQRMDEWISKAGLVLILSLAVFIFYVDFERIGLIDNILKIFRG